ncbi:MAG: hypothetical protein SOU19_02050 [Candidatus Caccosoma sp.]|nr:hypothetical protein [Candidatus Caccosoma sp.]
MKNLLNEKAFEIANICAKTNNSKTISFKFIIDKNDTYLINFSKNVISLKIYDENEKLIISSNSLFRYDFVENQIIFLKVTTNKANENFEIGFYPINNAVITPYKINIENNGSDIPLNGDNSIDPLKPAEIKMIKRKKGTYIYCNVPESITQNALNSITMQNKNLKGDCFMTFENSNHTDRDIYLGYRLKNNHHHDVYVSVSNVGYQVTGSWLGEKSWIDYYGIKYEMDKTGFDEKATKWFNDYLNFDNYHEPHAIKRTIYRIPPHQYIYVIGGTSIDSYNHINVNNTADNILRKRHCANGNVHFTVLNDSLVGEFCIYDDYHKINERNVTIQNLRKYSESDDFGGRLGISKHKGVIDCNPIWIFNDATLPSKLPVKYYPLYADKLKDTYEPFEKVTDNYRHEVISDRWLTHLSSQLNHNYVGDDILETHTICNGKKIVLSPNSATPAGAIWDFGNWMIEYQENLVFVNQGDKERTIKLTLINAGSILYMIKDENEALLKAGATFINCTGVKPIYEAKIKPHSKMVLSMQFVLPANNNGSVEHYVELV